MCNYENHKFFDLENNKVIFSKKFCRDIVENTLPTVKFFAVDVNKYFTLISKFLVSCNKDGVYEPDV